MNNSFEEPIYEDTDEDGNPVEFRKPKYTKPGTPFQSRILGACRRKHFKVGEKGQVIAIERTMISLYSTLQSKLPTEWVDQCIAFAVKQNTDAGYAKITLPNLVKYINNDSRKVDWVADYIRKNKLKMQKRMDDDSGLVEVNFE